MRHIIVINSKGGCGKTTIATNLASYYAAKGSSVALLDHDPQGSSLAWLHRRAANFPAIHGASASANIAGVTRSFQLRVPQGTDKVIRDTPASLKKMELADLLRGADAVVVPVLPSAIDRHVSINFLQELRTMARQAAPDVPIAVVANRVQANTLSLAQLHADLKEAELPVIASLRDTQNYVHAVELGLGIHEMNRSGITKDRAQWGALLHWLDTIFERKERTQLNVQGQLVAAF
jgi:chromosome partitioning protein